jgi:hypothetical protein
VIGLGDRHEAWARRFQSPPPAEPPAGQAAHHAPAEAVPAARRSGGRFAREQAGVPAGERAEPKEGRFRRRALQER